MTTLQREPPVNFRHRNVNPEKRTNEGRDRRIDSPVSSPKNSAVDRPVQRISMTKVQDSRIPQPTVYIPGAVDLRGSGPSFFWEKSSTVLGIVVGLVLAVLFGCDLATSWPFNHASTLFDVGILFSSAVLLYLSFHLLREQIQRKEW